MKNFNFKSKVGFTLIELLVVIGILAVLAAIAIPAVAGLIDRANVSADDTNANEMTNSVERFVSEYELFKQDIASGKFDKTKMDSAQGRVYAVTGVEDHAGIEALESTGTADGIALNIDTKYPVNEKTLKRVVNNYMKTSASTFTPKQSDCSYYYSPALGTVVCAETGSTIDDLSAIVLSYDSASVVKNSTMLATASNGVQVEWMNMTLNSGLEEAEWTDVVYATETQNVYKSVTSQIITPPEVTPPIENPDETPNEDGFDMSNVKEVLGENDWETIQAVIKAGKTEEAGWEVGSISPTFNIQGQNKQAMIVDIKENKATFMITTSIGWRKMTSSSMDYPRGKNINGYIDTQLKAWLDGEAYDSLDTDLKAVIAPTTITCADGYNNPNGTLSATCYLFLPSLKEVALNDNLPNSYSYKATIEAEGETFELFANGGCIDTTCFWLRSPRSTAETNFFQYIQDAIKTEASYYSGAVCPAFVIG